MFGLETLQIRVHIIGQRQAHTGGDVIDVIVILLAGDEQAYWIARLTLGRGVFDLDATVRPVAK